MSAGGPDRIADWPRSWRRRPRRRLRAQVEVPSEGPGPAQFDRSSFTRPAPADARRVLVLMPGTIGGAGDFALLAHDVVERVPGLQVWAIDRRSQPLEDTSMFARLEAAEASSRRCSTTTSAGSPTAACRPTTSASSTPPRVPFAREWGMQDGARGRPRRVVKLARAKGRKVILGGHSLGASLAAAYAAWDFDGRPGYKDLVGMVLIDGGLLGSFDAFDLAQAQAAIADLEDERTRSSTCSGSGSRRSPGCSPRSAATYARLAPNPRAPRRCRISRSFPTQFNPAIPVTNRACSATPSTATPRRRSWRCST